MKRLTLPSPRFITSSLSTLCEFTQKSLFNSAELSDTSVKAKTTKFFRVCYGKYGNITIFKKLAKQIIASSLLCVTIFFVKALRQ
jgi:hypothetical protein